MTNGDGQNIVKDGILPHRFVYIKGEGWEYEKTK